MFWLMGMFLFTTFFLVFSAIVAIKTDSFFFWRKVKKHHLFSSYEVGKNYIARVMGIAISVSLGVAGYFLYLYNSQSSFFLFNNLINFSLFFLQPILLTLIVIKIWDLFLSSFYNEGEKGFIGTFLSDKVAYQGIVLFAVLIGTGIIMFGVGVYGASLIDLFLFVFLGNLFFMLLYLFSMKDLDEEDAQFFRKTFSFLVNVIILSVIVLFSVWGKVPDNFSGIHFFLLKFIALTAVWFIWIVLEKIFFMLTESGNKLIEFISVGVLKVTSIFLSAVIMIMFF